MFAICIRESCNGLTKLAAEGVETRRQTRDSSFTKNRHCRVVLADTYSREGMVQTTNPKGAAKAVVGTHNPLVAGSNPAGPT